MCYDRGSKEMGDGNGSSPGAVKKFLLKLFIERQEHFSTQLDIIYCK